MSFKEHIQRQRRGLDRKHNGRWEEAGGLFIRGELGILHNFILRAAGGIHRSKLFVESGFACLALDLPLPSAKAT